LIVWERENMREQNGSRRQGRQSKHSEEFKRSVVDHWISSGKPAHQVAREFGVKLWNLRDWKRRYGMRPKAADEPVPEDPREMAREIAQLRRELARVLTQREILKKTLGIVSEP